MFLQLAKFQKSPGKFKSWAHALTLITGTFNHTTLVSILTRKRDGETRWEPSYWNLGTKWDTGLWPYQLWYHIQWPWSPVQVYICGPNIPRTFHAEIYGNFFITVGSLNWNDMNLRLFITILSATWRKPIWSRRGWDQQRQVWNDKK